VNKRNILRCLAAALMMACAPAQAQDGRPITIVVPYPPGGTADLLPRLLGPKVEALLGGPVVILNKPGAAGNLGADFVAQSPADGKTLLVVPPHFFVADILYKIKFVPRDFVPISIVATYPNVLLVGAKYDALDLKGFLATAKAAPVPLSAGSPGTGTSQHLSAEMLRLMGGFNYTHVPYKGSGPVLVDLIGGQLDFAFDNLVAALPMINSGRLKLVGVGSAKRNKRFPAVPAIQEVVPGFESVTWMGMVAPSGTSRAIANRLSNAFAQAARTPEIAHQIEDMQAEVVGGSSAAMAETVHHDVARWTKVIRAANVVVD